MSYDIESIIGLVLSAIPAVIFLVIIIDWVKKKFIHKHSLSVTMSPHASAGRGVHNVIYCSTCRRTWDLSGHDYYGTSTLLKGGKINAPLRDSELAEVLLDYAKSKSLVSAQQYSQLKKMTETNPSEVLKMFGK